MQGLREYKGYLLDCAYEEENVNKSFFKALRLKGVRNLKVKSMLGINNRRLILLQTLICHFQI